MKQNTIKLNEGQLKKIVAESVQKVLSELDWKTYANAANKALDRGYIDYWREKGVNFPHAVDKAANERLRAERFGDAAKDAFNHDYGYKKGNTFDDDYASVKLGGYFDATEEYGPHVVGFRSKGYGNPAKYERGWNRYTLKKETPEEFFQDNPDAAQSFRNSDAEVKNYEKGNYAYDSDKGWHLKESVEKAVKNVLKEYLNKNK